MPQGGKVLAAIASPWSLALVFAVAFGLFGSSRRPPKGRHAARRRTRPSSARSLPASFSMPTRAQARQVAIGAGAVALLAAAAGTALLALPSTETEARTLQVAQQGRFTYSAAAEAGTTYPTGVITTGDPIYTRLADSLEVSFEHSLTAPGLEDVAGGVRLELSVATADGWSTPLGSSPTVAVQDGTATARAEIDPILATSLVGRHNAEIGTSAGASTIVVTPVVDVTGSLRGQRFAAAELAPLTFTVDTAALRPPSAETAFAPTASVPVSVDEVVTRSFTVLGVSVPLPAARVIAVAVLVGSVLVGAVAGGIARPRPGDAADEFAVRNAARILPVTGLSPGRHVVDVSDADALRRVAERFDGLVLHHAGPDGQTFAVQDNETTYRFTFPDTAITRTPPPPPPVLVSLGAPMTAPLPRIA